ncbi:MAG: InlB B-repeat-containing protein [Oscillospiraceae bacterium]|nr:InlB B-repeat-containing protein [Oscillospiraceae bacterium]
MKISRLRRTLAVFLSAMLVLLCMPMMAITASAADYSYDASENYVTYNSDGLTVRFTMTDCGLNMHYWTVFLFDPAVFSSVTYDSNHKLTNSGSMGLESAAYAFETDNTSNETNVLQTAIAKTSSLDLKSSGKCLSDIWSTKNWVVVLGPYHNWNGTNYYNCDYYIGNANNIPASAPSPKYTITFDPNGGELPSDVASTAQTTDGKLTSAQLAVTPTYEGFTFKGWFTAATDGTPVTTDTTFSGNDTIYAQWEAVSTGGDVAAYSTAYAYDCSRTPSFPTKGSDVTLRGFSAPLIDTNRNKKGTTSGDWKLIKKGAYNASYEEGHSSTLISLLETTASNFGTEYTNIDVYELRDGDTHICYGVLSAFMSKGYFFIGTTWGNGGAGYFLSDEVCSGPMTETVTGDPTSPPEPEPEPEPEPDPSEYDITTDEIKDAGYMDLKPGTRIYVNTDTFKTGRKTLYVDTYEAAVNYGYINDSGISEEEIAKYGYYYEEELAYGSIITLKSKYQANADGDGDILCGGTWRCTVDGENDGVLEIYSTTPTEDCPDPDKPHTHKFGEWTIVKEATTTEEGLLERVCECGEKETKVIDKLVDTDKDNDNGNVVDITPDDNAGGAALDDIEDVAENIPLEPEEYIAIQEGEDLKIYLEVVDVTDASETMPEADKALIEEKINSVNNMKQGMLIDVSLFKKVGGSEPTKVTNTKAPIRIVFEMPESLINKNSNVVRKYYIIRVHEGVADTLDGSFDVASKKFTFETDRFSSYAIAYTDYAIGSPSIPSAPGSSESSSNKHTHNYVWKNDSTSHWQRCNCGGVNDKGAHTFGDWEIVKEPTETEDGIKKHTCTVCGYSETNTIEDVSSGAGDVVANDILEVTEKDITLAITFIISAAVIGMTIAKRRRVSK